ncbi:MAG: hypothetical protein A2571_01105 [Candidatus Vogelbacteria bacterium RIFOXYD1_FULL_44_32]|uniref:CMP/dCMP-type deaminase domain-containing protein n=1 Tax=Candidatus Vogelbacteria bacterium RIFOXYD1_FULL_44_32 TaxID=1802438 RepID=A0A1G2QEP9_9BACT|nr:MAG: hypothetical protein A2571_01105 [Candidatus Vogelbacteria bacterium RIFOXYD1_FULL_44_32]
MKVLVAYIPVIHAGYLALLQKYKDCHLAIIGGELLDTLPYLKRDFRACPAHLIEGMIRGLGFFSPIVGVVRTGEELIFSCAGVDEIILPDEDISRACAEKYLAGLSVTYASIWLRWDKKNATSEKEPSPNRLVTSLWADQVFMGQAEKCALSSSDWWRQVGAVVVKNDQVLITAFNHHLPTAQTPYINGDPRGNFDWGERIDLCTAIHAEAAIVAQAAKSGLSLEGASLYSSTFPCPGCANLLAETGIAKVYYREGYSLLDAETVFGSAGIELVKVL